MRAWRFIPLRKSAGARRCTAPAPCWRSGPAARGEGEGRLPRAVGEHLLHDERLDVLDGEGPGAREGHRRLFVGDLLVEHGGLDGVGHDQGDGDAVLAQLDRGGEGEAADGELGGAVEGEAGDGGQGGERADVDDVAGAPGDHAAGGGAGAEDHALGVDVEVEIHVALGEIDDVPGLEVAGDVHDHVDAPQRAGGVERGLPLVLAAHVEAAEADEAAIPAARLGLAGERGLVEIGGDDAVAERGEGAGEVPADAAGAAGEEHDGHGSPFAQPGGEGKLKAPARTPARRARSPQTSARPSPSTSASWIVAPCGAQPAASLISGSQIEGAR